MIRDEIKKQTVKMKDMTFRQKAGYISDYYKWPIIITILAIIGIAAFIHERVTATTNIFYCEMVNSNVYSEELCSLLPDFEATDKSFNPKKEDMFIDYSMHIDKDNPDTTSMTYQEKMAAMFNVAQLDVVIANKAVIDDYASMDAFADLSTTLPKDLYQKLQDSGYEIYYADITDDSSSSSSVKKVPAGVYIGNCPAFKKGYTDSDGNKLPIYPDGDEYTPIFTIAANAPHTDISIAFLRYLIS